MYELPEHCIFDTHWQILNCSTPLAVRQILDSIALLARYTLVCYSGLLFFFAVHFIIAQKIVHFVCISMHIKK